LEALRDRAHGRREAAVETHHQAIVTTVRDRAVNALQLFEGKSERFFDECCLRGAHRFAHEPCMR
jgi:hypothetical protein